MIYTKMPTITEFYEHTGTTLSGKLRGDMKNQEDLADVLFKNAYREIFSHLPGIRVEELTTDDEANWKILIMEQAEFMLSLGDRVLTGESNSSLSPKIPRLASSFGLWSRYFHVNFK